MEELMSGLHTRIEELPPDKIDLLRRRIRERKRGGPQTRIIARSDRGNQFPLSFAQQRLWFMHQLDPNSCALNLPCVVRVTGRFDLRAFERTLTEIVKRHEILRTTF